MPYKSPIKKIAFVYLSNYVDWPMGGMLSYVRNLIPYFMDEKKYSIDYWGCSVDKKRIDNFIIANNEYNLNIYANVKTSNKIIPNFIRSFFLILKHRKLFNKYDIIYSHTSATTIALKLAFPKKFVVHHQHGLSYVKNKGIEKILNIGYVAAQRIANMTFFVASSNEVKEYKKSNFWLKKKSFYSIGSPINVEHIVQKRKIVSEHLQFIYTGRLTEWKNVEFIIESFSRYKTETSQPCQLLIVGTGPSFESLNVMVNEKKLNDYVVFEGEKTPEEVIDCLKKSDVFLFASKGEGVSVSILEALAAGLPIVACDAMGVRNQVRNSETGYLARDFIIEDYVKCMKMAVSKRKELEKKCISYAYEFDSHSIANTILSVIDHEYKNQKQYKSN